MLPTESASHTAESLQHRIAEGFAERLAPHFVLERLESHPASVFGLLSSGHIAYVNPAWVRFARENGADTGGRPWIGQRYLDVIAAPLRPFYTELFALAPVAGSALQPVTHVYECSTAELFRQFAMQVYKMAHDAGFIVINTLVASRPHDDTTRVPQAPDRALYVAEDGVVVQCSHCRLIRRADASGWDWVPDWINTIPNETSHGVCEVCLEYYYPASD